ncbi:MAG TPA: hypothetical protein VHC69_24960 [Polyangiaceae bacterium]|nr:hypothetical protein [Polyangiaceae bacterium]
MKTEDAPDGDSDDAEGWDDDFFKVLGAWWRGETVPAECNAELRRAIDAWLPATSTELEERTPPRQSETNELAPAPTNGAAYSQSG